MQQHHFTITTQPFGNQKHKSWTINCHWYENNNNSRVSRWQVTLAFTIKSYCLVWKKSTVLQGKNLFFFFLKENSVDFKAFRRTWKIYFLTALRPPFIQMSKRVFKKKPNWDIHTWDVTCPIFVTCYACIWSRAAAAAPKWEPPAEAWSQIRTQWWDFHLFIHSFI